MNYQLENDCLRVAVNSLGAELWNLHNKTSDQPLLWQGDPEYWPRRSPILFPVCGKRKCGDLPLHGFIRDYQHTLVEQTPDRLTFVCRQNDETLALYPYRFSFYTTYQLEGSSLHCTLRIVNDGPEVMPFSVGFHSGFMANDSSRLVFARPEYCDRLLTDEDGLLLTVEPGFLSAGQELPLTTPLFPDMVLLKSLVSQQVELVTDNRPVLRLDFAGFPYLVVWVNKQPVRFVCIEPWYDLPDPQNPPAAFAHKPGLCQLPGGQAFLCTQTITAL